MPCDDTTGWARNESCELIFSCGALLSISRCADWAAMARAPCPLPLAAATALWGVAASAAPTSAAAATPPR